MKTPKHDQVRWQSLISQLRTERNWSCGKKKSQLFADGMTYWSCLKWTNHLDWTGLRHINANVEKKKKSNVKKNTHRLIGSEPKGVIQFPIAPRYNCLKLDVSEEQVWINVEMCSAHLHVHTVSWMWILAVHLQRTFLPEIILLSALSQSLCVGLPAQVSVQLGSFQSIRSLQDPPADNDDVRALVEDDFLWSGVLLPQNIPCKRDGSEWGEKTN